MILNGDLSFYVCYPKTTFCIYTERSKSFLVQNFIINDQLTVILSWTHFAAASWQQNRIRACRFGTIRFNILAANSSNNASFLMELKTLKVVEVMSHTSLAQSGKHPAPVFFVVFIDCLCWHTIRQSRNVKSKWIL